MAKAVDGGEGGSLVGLRELGSTLPQYRRAHSRGWEEPIRIGARRILLAMVSYKRGLGLLQENEKRKRCARKYH